MSAPMNIEHVAVAGITAGTSQQEVKITPANRAVLKTLKDLNTKKARAEHHRTLLTNALAEGHTIGDLRREVRPQLPEIPVDFAIEWEEAHIVFTDTLTKLLGKYWNNRKDVIDKEIETTTSRLALGTSEPEKARITELAHVTFDQEVAKLEAPKPQRPARQWQRAKRRKPIADSTPGRSTDK
jgi:hypothetical protein